MMTFFSPARSASLRGGSVRSGSAHAPWRLAFMLAFAALFCGVLLTGVSVWFLGAVALAGAGPMAYTFNFHIPAALVRLFALGRTAAKYGERVAGHRAALFDQVARRGRLFAAMAAQPCVRAAGWQFGDQDRLADYMDDVEDVDYARLRVALPVAALLAGFVALAGLTLWLVPLAILPIAALFAAMAGMARRVMPRAAGDWRFVRAARRSAGRKIDASLASIVPLKAEGAWRETLGNAFGRFAEAEARLCRQRRELAMFDAMIGLAGPLVMLSVIAAAWHAGSRGSALLPPAFLAFAWLALGEMAQGASRILSGRLRGSAAAAEIGRWTALSSSLDDPPRPFPRLSRLKLRGVPRLAPDGRPLGGIADLSFQAGRPTTLMGPSGCGKTSLLKQIAGWIGTKEGRFCGDGVDLDASQRRNLTCLGLHDAAVLSDTIRENLFAEGATDAECWQALTAVELDQRVRVAGGLDAWITQDMLSLGEARRLSLARAWLTGRPIVLLDEPTEHLDHEQAERILARLALRFKDRILVFSTHDANITAGLGDRFSLLQLSGWCERIERDSGFED